LSVLQRSTIEDANSGFLQSDSLEIHYRCELLMTDGGALASTRGSPFAAEVPCVPPSSLNIELTELLQTGGAAQQGYDKLAANREAYKSSACVCGCADAVSSCLPSC
jgi:hypothetical protein